MMYTHEELVKQMQICLDAAAVFKQRGNIIAADKMKNIADALITAAQEIDRLRILINDQQDDIPF